MTWPVNDAAWPFEAALASAMVSDQKFSARYPQRRHWARQANSSEVRVVQALERRLLTPTPGCEVLALVRLTHSGHRQRVLIEAAGVDPDQLSEAEAAALFADIVHRARVRQ